MGAADFVSGSVGVDSQSEPVGFEADPKSAEWAIVLKGGNLALYLFMLLLLSYSFSGFVREVSVNVDKGVRNALPALDGLDLGFA